jgi:hypothetical protein
MLRNRFKVACWMSVKTSGCLRVSSYFQFIPRTQISQIKPPPLSSIAFPFYHLLLFLPFDALVLHAVSHWQSHYLNPT